MAKLSFKNPTGTSFHNVTIRCTANQMIRAIGEAQWGNNDGRDKVNFDWICETKYGAVFTVYDWKFYRPLDLDEEVAFHIGAHRADTALTAQKELLKLFSEKG